MHCNNYISLLPQFPKMADAGSTVTLRLLNCLPQLLLLPKKKSWGLLPQWFELEIGSFIKKKSKKEEIFRRLSRHLEFLGVICLENFLKDIEGILHNFCGKACTKTLKPTICSSGILFHRSFQICNRKLEK